MESIAATELKASRLLTPFVGLLTAAVAVTAIQLVALDSEDWISWGNVWPLFGVISGTLGCGWLICGLSRALDSDTRLGQSIYPSVEDELDNPARALTTEFNASALAKWVQKNKANRILFARAAISRALTFLTISAAFGAVGLVLKGGNETSGIQPPGPEPRVTVTVTTLPPSSPTTPSPQASTTLDADPSSTVSPSSSPLPSSTSTSKP